MTFGGNISPPRVGKPTHSGGEGDEVVEQEDSRRGGDLDREVVPRGIRWLSVP